MDLKDYLWSIVHPKSSCNNLTEIIDVTSSNCHLKYNVMLKEYTKERLNYDSSAYSVTEVNGVYHAIMNG